MRRYIGETYPDKQGNALSYGEWYNFGGNVSLMRRSPNSYRLRLDTTGKVVTPAGPAGRDAIMMGLYGGYTPEGYARFNFGTAFEPSEKT